MKKTRMVVAAAFGLMLALDATAASYDAWMKIEGVPGESSDPKHSGWIEVLSTGGGAVLPAPPSGPAPAGIAKGGPSSISITRRVDRSSPILQHASTTGKPFPAATIEMRKAGGDPHEYLKYELKNVMISSYRAAPRGDGGAAPTETITFTFGAIELKYDEQKGPTRPGPGVASAPAPPAPSVKPK